MIRSFLLSALVALVCLHARAQSSNATANAELASILNFERDHSWNSPDGWVGVPSGTIYVDSEVKHSGKWAARIERTPSSPQQNFSTLRKWLPMDFAGDRIELRGFLRTEDVSDYAGLWLREDGSEEDGSGGEVEFADMRQRQLNGTTEWSEYSISLPLNPAGRKVYFGVVLKGTGRAWADDLQLLVDGKPVWEAPKVNHPKTTAIELDPEFDGGSRVSLSKLTPVQIQNLVTLGKVWGFLKYHHPRITSGTRHWDYDLFRVLPKVLAAPDRNAANKALLNWIAELGPVVPCKPRAKLDKTGLHLRPDLAWLADKALLGAELSKSLRAIHTNRLPGKQFYVSLVPNIGNPAFAHEPGYPQISRPDAGYQLLALYRFWNIIEYWSPYRDLIDDDWDTVLSEFIPRVAQANSADAYQLELMALIAKVHDSHGYLGSSVHPPVGDSQLPVVVRFIDGRPVVTDLIASETSSGLQRGDVISAIDGSPVAELVVKWSPYYPASNDPTRQRDIARVMGRGPAGPVKVRVQRGNETVEVEATRVPIATSANTGGLRHDLPGPTFRLLSKEVAYLKLSSVKADDAVSYVQQAAGTKGWIIDARNYPSEAVVFALGSHFIQKPTDFARFTHGNVTNPGAFSFRMKPNSLLPQAPHYAGKIVILVDEVTQSNAEYTTMAFRSAPGALVVGSTTAAADGNVSSISLPGGLSTRITGIGVFYPDKRPTQRVGIVPDIVAKPTLAGIQARRDEVLEVALQQILGPQTGAEEIRKLIPISSIETTAARENPRAPIPGQIQIQYVAVPGADGATEYRDPEFALSLKLPAGWKITRAARLPDHTTTVQLSNPMARSFTFLWFRMLPEPQKMSPEEAYKAMAGNPEATAADRTANGTLNYIIRANSRQQRTIGGLPALSCVAYFTSWLGQPMAEYLVWIHGEKARALFRGVTAAGELDTFRERFDRVIETAKIP